MALQPLEIDLYHVWYPGHWRTIHQAEGQPQGIIVNGTDDYWKPTTFFDNFEKAYRWSLECKRLWKLPEDHYFQVTRLRLPITWVWKMEDAVETAGRRWGDDSVIVSDISRFIVASVRYGATHVSWHDIPLVAIIKE